MTVDVRGVTAFLGAHIPDSLAMPHDMVPAFAGRLLDPDEDLVLVADGATQAEAATRHLARIGYDNVWGFLASPLTGWASEARLFRSLPVVDVADVARRVDERPNGWTLLDVRDKGEVDDGIVDGSEHIYVGKLPAHLSSLEREHHYTVMCESGARATIAASVLLRAGFQHVDVFLGSMGAWQSAGGTTVKPTRS